MNKLCDSELVANGAAPKWGSFICGKNIAKKKGKNYAIRDS